MKIQAQSKRHITPIPILGPTRREKLKGNHKLVEPKPRFSSKFFGIGALTLKPNYQLPSLSSFSFYLSKRRPGSLLPSLSFLRLKNPQTRKAA